LVLKADGSLTYTPSAGFFGSDSFTYKANDGKLDSNTATVSITVSKVITALPTSLAYAGPVSTTFGPTTLTATLTVRTTHAGLSGRKVTFSIDGGAPQSATTNSSGSASFTPSLPLDPGTHAITINFAGDSGYQGASATGSLRILNSDAGTADGSGLKPSTGGSAEFHVDGNAPGPAGLRGSLTYEDRPSSHTSDKSGAPPFHLEARQITAFGVVAGSRSAWFAGTSRDGRSFLVYVEDNGFKPGPGARTADVFKLWIDGVLETGDGALDGGKVDVSTVRDH